jgi:hypothetical protein
MEKSPGHFVLHLFHVPIGVTVPDMGEKHSLRRGPDIETDPNPLGGLLLSEHLRHSVVHDLNLSWIQSHGPSGLKGIVVEPVLFEATGSIGESTFPVK